MTNGPGFSAISRFLLPSEPIGARDFLRSVREACRLRLGSQAFASGQPRIPPRSERQATVEDNLPVAEISKDSATFNNITPNTAVRLMLGETAPFSIRRWPALISTLVVARAPLPMRLSAHHTD